MSAIAAAVTAAIAGGGGAWLIGAARAWGRDSGPDLDQAAVSRAVSAALTVNPARGFAAAQRIGWAELLRRGALTPVAPVISDPGNPGRWLGLFEDATGALGMGAVRVLIVVNGSPKKRDGSHTVHGIPVPAGITTPLEAAAWAHDDPTHPLRCTVGDYVDLAWRS
ncbi:MAG TPA: hypothetical protein VFP72_19225 [Kineosporiaceae bacterium]|nr:hypothetical protein [Kineosporiaceae bacterium]